MSEARDQTTSYLLGELEGAEAAAFERGMEADPELRAEVEALRPVVGRLEALPPEVWDPPEPPPLRTPTAAGPPPPSRRRRLRLPTLKLRPAPAAALATLLLAVGVVGGLLIGGDSGGDGSSAVEADLVLNRIDDGPTGAHGDVLLTAGEQRATLAIAGLDPSGEDRFYELWLLDDDGRMIALGSFRVGADGAAEVELPLPVEPERYRYFDVSLQEDNGDPAHSGVSVLRGPTSS